ncbi:MAG: flavodoxin domain-containing protein [Pseudomonadota bacterium]
MRILVAYASVEGQTLRIARFVASRIAELGHTAELFDADVKGAVASFDEFDRIVLAASVHRRRHPVEFEKFLARNRDTLAGFPTLQISVSLCAAFPQGMEEAQSYLDEMQERTGFAATQGALVAGALQFEKYKDYESQVVRFIALDLKRFDVVDEDHEFTDWSDVAARVDAFLSA